MNDRYDVAVIGAGIVGVSTALHLQMRGKKVLLLDKREPGEETSYGNAGIIENSYVLTFSFPGFSRWPGILAARDAAAHLHYPSLPRLIPWLLEFFLHSQTAGRRRNGLALRPLITIALEEHKKLMQGTDAERYLSASGRVKIHRSEASFLSDALEREVAKEVGVPFEVLEPGAFAEIEPHLKPGYYRAVRWTGSARLTSPGVVVKEYARRFTAGGGVFQRAAVHGLMRQAVDWKIFAKEGNFTAKEIVICAGPWSGELLKGLGYRFPLAFKRGYHRHFAAEGNATLKHALIDSEYGYALMQMEQGMRITTGAEFAGMEIPENPVQIDMCLPLARELFPLGEPVNEKPWMGCRPCLPDSLPIIDAAPRHPDLWFNFGHGHSGLTIGPPSGRLMAELITREKPFCDPAPYRATRF